MANRYLYQFHYSFNPMLSSILGNFSIDAGDVASVQGGGVRSVVRLETGIFQINLDDGWPRYLHSTYNMNSQVLSGVSVPDGSFVVGTLYSITNVGDTDWAAVGVPSSVTPAVGVAFVATAVGGAGTGTVEALGASGIASVEVLGDPQSQIKNGIVLIGCYDDAGALADPADGTVVSFEIMCRNSELLLKGE